MQLKTCLNENYGLAYICKHLITASLIQDDLKEDALSLLLFSSTLEHAIRNARYPTQINTSSRSPSEADGPLQL
jgi:hypothetical protein